MTVSAHNLLFKMLKALSALPVIWPLEYSASFLVALLSGSQMFAKSLCVLKKSHSPTNDLISFLRYGILAVFTALSLSFPGLMPTGVNRSPK